MLGEACEGRAGAGRNADPPVKDSVTPVLISIYGYVDQTTSVSWNCFTRKVIVESIAQSMMQVPYRRYNSLYPKDQGGDTWLT
jgi:hypothetical protein